MIPPAAQTVHPGRWTPRGDRFERIQRWLRANGIDPARVSPRDPVFVLSVPHHEAASSLEDNWLIDVIVFTELYTNTSGRRELNYLTREAAKLQRTVPLQVPFPTDPTTDGEAHGQGKPQVEAVEEGQRTPQHQGGPEEDEQQELRSAGEALQGGRSSSRSERTRQGVAARIAGGEESRTGSRDPQVPQPEEDGPQEEGLTR